jgi:hypothetical protein
MLIRLFATVTKRNLIIMLSIGFLLSISCIGLILVKQILTEQNNNKERIKALEDALTQAVINAQANLQALTKAQDAKNKGSNNEDEINRLKKELERTIQEATAHKQALENLRKQQEAQTYTTQQHTTKTITSPDATGQSYQSESPMDQEAQEPLQKTNPIEDLRQKAVDAKILENILKETQEKYPDINVGPTPEKTPQKTDASSTAPESSNGYYQQQSDPSASPMQKQKTSLEQANDLLDRQFEQQRQRFINQEINTAQKDCINQIKKSVKKAITGAA